MKIAIIGRNEILYETVIKLKKINKEIAYIITSKEAPEYTKTSRDFEKLANELKIPFIKSTNLENYYEFIKSQKADIAVSINFNGLIPESIINLFPCGILNAHGGDLPKYKGNACQAWAIINGEDSIGLCIIKMSKDLDSGDIISRKYKSINLNTKVTELCNWMFEVVPDLMIESIEKLSMDKAYFLEKQSQNPKDSLRCFPRTPADGRIKWEMSAVDILRLINASNKPYAGAYCFFNNLKLIIWDAEILNIDANFLAIPGQVIKIKKDYVDLACGIGYLRVKKVEYEGRETYAGSIIKSIRNRMT